MWQRQVVWLPWSPQVHLGEEKSARFLERAGGLEVELEGCL